MKKFFCVMTVIVLTAILVIPAFGKSEFDAFNINEEEASEYKFKADDNAVMIYSGIYFTEFAKGADVYDIINSDSGDRAYLVSSDNLIQIRYKNEGEVKTAPISCLARACLSQMCVKAQDHGSLFDSETEVINTFIFHEMWGFSVYFVTNKGEYVMYKDSVVTETIYLMPESVYRECARGMVDFMKSTEGGTCPGYTYFEDLSEYQIYPEPMPDITILPETEDVPPQTNGDGIQTDVTEPEETEESKESLVPETQISAEDSESVNVSAVIILSAALPTVILGAVIVIILKRK